MNDGDALDFLNSIKKEIEIEIIEDKFNEIVDVLKSGEARQAANTANKALKKAGLKGVTIDPSEIVERIKFDGESIILMLTEEDDRLIRYDSLYGSGVFDALGIKRNLNDASS